MRYEEILQTFAEFFEAETIEYAATGDVALHAWGIWRVKPNIAFVVDPAGRNRIIAFAESLGYATTYASPKCSTHRNESFAFANVTFVYRHVTDATTKLVAGDVRLRVASPGMLAAQSLFFERDPFSQASMIATLAAPGTTRTIFEQAFGDVYLAMPTREDLDAISHAANLELPSEEWLHWNTLITRDVRSSHVTNSLHDEPFEL